MVDRFEDNSKFGLKFIGILYIISLLLGLAIDDLAQRKSNNYVKIMISKTHLIYFTNVEIALLIATAFFFVLAILIKTFGGATLNRVSLSFKEKKVYYKSPVVRQMLDLNREAREKTSTLDYNINKFFSNLKEFRNYIPETAVHNIDICVVKKQLEQNLDYSSEYEAKAQAILQQANEMEKNIIKALIHKIPQSPIVTVHCSYSSPTGRSHSNYAKTIPIKTMQEISDPDFTPLGIWLQMRAGICDYTGIYILKNLRDGRCYVGQSKNVAKRIQQHISGTGNPDFYRDYTVGIPFGIRTLSLVESGYRNLDTLEREMIKKYSAYTMGYNRNAGNMT